MIVGLLLLNGRVLPLSKLEHILAVASLAVTLGALLMFIIVVKAKNPENQ